MKRPRASKKKPPAHPNQQAIDLLLKAHDLHKSYDKISHLTGLDKTALLDIAKRRTKRSHPKTIGKLYQAAHPYPHQLKMLADEFKL